MDPPPFKESPEDSNILPDALESAPPTATHHNSPHTMSGSIEAAHYKAFKKKMWGRKRALKKMQEKGKLRMAPAFMYMEYKIQSSLSKKYGHLTATRMDFNTRNPPYTRAVYIGVWLSLTNRPEILTLEKLLGEGYNLDDWDSIWAFLSSSPLYSCWLGLSTSQVLMDCKGRIVVILAGCPTDPMWHNTICGWTDTTAKAWDEGFVKGAFTKANSDHHWGRFSIINTGMLFGEGKKVWSIILFLMFLVTENLHRCLEILYTQLQFGRS